MNQVIALEVGFETTNGINRIYPTLLIDDIDMILVDCGYPHSLLKIKAAAEKAGFNLDELTKIIITHHDYDHMGALKEFKKAYPNISVVSSVIEEKYISGKEKSLRLQQAERIYPSLPEDQKPGAEAFHKILRSLEHVNVDCTVVDKDKFSWCGGIEIVATPGHMPGHIGIYLIESKTFIAGDGMVVENGELGMANPRYTLDMPEAMKSIAKLLDYDIERIICYHGGLIAGDVRAALQGLIKK